MTMYGHCVICGEPGERVICMGMTRSDSFDKCLCTTHKKEHREFKLSTKEINMSGTIELAQEIVKRHLGCAHETPEDRCHVCRVPFAYLELLKKLHWRDVKGILPDNHQYVLIWWQGLDHPIQVRYVGGSFCNTDGNKLPIPCPAYWMPTPEPPSK